ncbi:MAG TPA: metal ABC transporter permease [Methylomirabilota bacterium]|jgi:zinc/manganese transport system permease protein|nr:metal ABC transporter permease [Methylomirabilota bacterium]
MTLEVIGWPLAAALVLAGIHAWLGLHVLARGVIFVDLALAQVSALGATVALLAGHPPQGVGAYWYALAFTAGGAALLAALRERPGLARAAIPAEAVIGIVYAVAAALTVLVLERVPLGGEQVKALLVGSLLGVTGEDVRRLAALYAAIGLACWLARRPLAALSFGGALRHARLWDFGFYLVFGLVVTSSVRVAGVLLVFAYLIVPAVAGAALAATPGRRLLIGWGVGTLGSVAGIAASFHWDLPTGATVVATLGALLAAVGAARGARALARGGRRAAWAALAAAGVAVALAGAALTAVPRADHLWLDALERALPSVQHAFLSAHERRVAAEAREAIARGAREVAALRVRQADVAWGTRAADAEERERMRQFTLGREELVAGDRMVLGTLRARARERQRWWLGPPMIVGGSLLVAVARLKGRRRVP